VSSGEAPANMHDEFAQLLVEGVSSSLTAFHSAATATSESTGAGAGTGTGTGGSEEDLNDLEIRETDAEALMMFKIYRRKLQTFLLTSQDYHPQRVVKFLPHLCLHEQSLVLCRLGEHTQAIGLFLHAGLRDLRLAEWYCDRVYTAFQLSLHPVTGAGVTGGGGGEGGGGSGEAATALGTKSSSGSNVGGGSHVRGPGGSTTLKGSLLGSNLRSMVIKRDDSMLAGLHEAGDVYIILLKVSRNSSLKSNF
jgi:hypothetical protein